MKKRTYERLCNDLYQYIDTVLRKSVPVKKRVAMTLYKLAGNECLGTISNLFGAGISTVCGIVNEVCLAIRQYLMPEYIKKPKGERLKTIIQTFQDRCGLPQVGGAIDGSHIIISNLKSHS